MVLRNRTADGIRIRLLCGEWSENAWVSFTNFETSRIPSGTFEITQVDSGLFHVSFQLPAFPAGAIISVGLMLLDQSDTLEYPGRGRSVTIEALRVWETRAEAQPTSVTPASQTTSEKLDFVQTVLAMKNPRILELGTRRSNPLRSTMRKTRFPNAGEYLGTDIQPGLDVDIVADVHRLSQYVGVESFDVIMSFSTFEHIKYPVIAALEIMKSLKVGGHVFIQTHQTYHLHAYPYDYCRFSKEGLSSLFPSTMNVEILDASHHYPAQIHSDVVPYNPENKAFLNTHIWVRKTGETPDQFLYDLEALVPC